MSGNWQFSAADCRVFILNHRFVSTFVARAVAAGERSRFGAGREKRDIHRVLPGALAAFVTWVICQLIAVTGPGYADPAQILAAEMPGIGIVAADFEAADSPLWPSDDRASQSTAEPRQDWSRLKWTFGGFTVSCRPGDERGPDAWVRYPSPRPLGIAPNDDVVLEWYAVRDENGNVAQAPAAIVVHESGRGMTVGRMFAKGFMARGVHGFLLQLPFYGQRRPAGISERDLPDDARDLVKIMTQAAGDVRRAHDAVASLPAVQRDCIALQGTSLGGFVTATVAGMDSPYQRVFVTLAGGNIAGIIEQGTREAAQLRKLMAERGLEGEKLAAAFDVIEPLNYCRNWSRDDVWVFSANKDQVVPPENSRLLVERAGLPPAQHVELWADHYTGIVYFPLIMDQMVELIRAKVTSQSPVFGE